MSYQDAHAVIVLVGAGLISVAVLALAATLCSSPGPMAAEASTRDPRHSSDIDIEAPGTRRMWTPVVHPSGELVVGATDK